MVDRGMFAPFLKPSQNARPKINPHSTNDVEYLSIKLRSGLLVVRAALRDPMLGNVFRVSTSSSSEESKRIETES